MSDAQSPDTPDVVPPGWVLTPWREKFAGAAGPYYFREGEASGVGIVVEERHLNLGGLAHGGCLATLADMSLWDICRRKVGPFRGVTVTMNTEFLGPGHPGEFIYAEGDALKSTGSLMFARGVVRAGERVIMNFSGTVKRLRAD
ncbi:MAG: PaaI family thioesterase [Alphaproteobacteria bacterium]|nr:PaaI family thioesterase [Alphaproteobacteria bacterium]